MDNVGLYIVCIEVCFPSYRSHSPNTFPTTMFFSLLLTAVPMGNKPSQTAAPPTVEQLQKARFWSGISSVVQLAVGIYLFSNAAKDNDPVWMCYVNIALGVLAVLGAGHLFRRYIHYW